MVGYPETTGKEVGIISSIEKMKNVFFTLAFMLIGSLAFANTTPVEMPIGDVLVDVVIAQEEAVAAPEEDLAAPAACWIVAITVSCGGTYNTQYCNEGLHGTLGQWAMQVDSWACDH
ncbi:MAG: hypothetical protein ACKV1O_21565 [Saprospiraceae bacterium]